MGDSKKICVAGDHAGFELKETVKKMLANRGFDVFDCGAAVYDGADDYPVFAHDLGRRVGSGEFSRALLFCGSGVGASIAANRHKGVRAALCFTPEMGKLCRRHNDANVLVLGSRITPLDTCEQIIDAWLNEPFEGGRHQARIDMLDNF